jgi:hypothetical protein
MAASSSFAGLSCEEIDFKMNSVACDHRLIGAALALVEAARPFVAVIVLAAVIASRKTQLLAVPLSASELTVMVSARAAVLGASAKAVAITDTSTARMRHSALLPAPGLCAQLHTSKQWQVGG